MKSAIADRIVSNVAIAVIAFSLAVGIHPATSGKDAVVEVLIGPTTPVPEKTAASNLINPFAIEFAASGDMVIVEYEGGRILSWNAETGLRHLAGDGVPGYVDGPAKQARFNQLHNLAILADGSMLLSDHVNHAIRKYDPATEMVSTLAGNGKPGPAATSVHVSATTFNQPICVALAPDKSSALVADINNRRIRRIELGTGMVSIVAGNGTKGLPEDGGVAIDSPLLDPRGAIENVAGEIFVMERNGHRLYRIDSAGTITTVVGSGKAGRQDGAALEATMNGPKHLCFGPGGTIYIADDNNHAVRKYDPQAGTLTTVDLGSYKLNRPHGVCVHDGWLYIADSFHHRVLRVSLD